MAPGQRQEATILNRISEGGHLGLAEVEYLSGDFRITRPGDYVLCAVTGNRIPLGELRYWSYELQEAFSTADAMLQRHRERLQTGN